MCCLMGALVSCQEEPTVVEGCDEAVLTDLGMEPYTDQVTNCRNYVLRYETNSEAYYLLANDCADIAADPFDCSFESVSQTAFDRATLIGIIGVDPE